MCVALFVASSRAEGYRPSGTTREDSSFIFGIHPYANPQTMLADYAPVMRYLEQWLPGTRFVVEASKDYADYEEKLVRRRFHFSLPNPYQTVLAMDHGYRVIAKMTPDENFRGLFVARTESPLKKPQDLVGRTVCFPSATAVAGTMLPLLFLHQQGVALETLKIKYVGSQDSSILTAFAGDAAACGSTVRFYGNWAGRNPEQAQQMQILWRTDSLPHNGVVARDDLPATLVDRVARALAGMDRDTDLDQGQFKKDQHHFELASDGTYQPMRDFLRTYDEVIGLPATMQGARDR
ncbi:MAG: hypothetical protein BWK76_11140 [Desulfobulbaceae bacterium A2]|nr:MAG: hypothetical protein BWK76_11140 [Desulfobulbaceae bacterium A2]